MFNGQGFVPSNSQLSLSASNFIKSKIPLYQDVDLYGGMKANSTTVLDEIA